MMFRSGFHKKSTGEGSERKRHGEVPGQSLTGVEDLLIGQ